MKHDLKDKHFKLIYSKTSTLITLFNFLASLKILYVFLILLFTFSNSCTKTHLFNFKENKKGGLLIAYNNINVLSLKFLENELKINTLSNHLAFIDDLDIGFYSISFKYNNNTCIISKIKIKSDSITILPLYEVLSKGKDNIDIKENSLSFITKIKDYGYTPNCRMQGTVIDGTSGIPLRNAQVFIKDFPWWSDETDMNGNYCISNILPGIFQATSYYTNYHNTVIKNIQFYSDSVSQVNFSLLPSILPEKPIETNWSPIFINKPCN